MSPKGQPKKARSGAERKRRASSSSVSSVSSVSSLEDLSDKADESEDDADDEEDRPLAKAPSYNRRLNKGRKTGRQPAMNKKRRISEDQDWSGSFSGSNSDSEDSSDDVYAAVDYITDADDEDRDVEKLEEMMILESESHYRVLPSSELNDEWNGSNGFGDSMFLPAASFFDEEQLYSAMDTFGETDMASEAVETPVARRVHFEERSDSSSDDSESHTDDEISGDFLQQDSLDPQLRQMIENDNHDQYHRSHRRYSEDIFPDTDYSHGNIYHVESDGTSEGSLSGYESMLVAWTRALVSLLTQFQPTTVIPQMKTFPRLLPLPTPVLFCVAIPPTLWPLSVMTSVTPSHAAGVRLWARSKPILTSP